MGGGGGGVGGRGSGEGGTDRLWFGLNMGDASGHGCGGSSGYQNRLGLDLLGFVRCGSTSELRLTRTDAENFPPWPEEEKSSSIYAAFSVADSGVFPSSEESAVEPAMRAGPPQSKKKCKFPPRLQKGRLVSKKGAEL